MSQSYGMLKPTLDHTLLIELIGRLGYRNFIDKDGLCYGIAVMALQAALAEDLETFDKRLKIISKEIEHITVEDFAKKIKGIENKRIELLASHKEVLLESLGLSPDMGAYSFSRVLEKYKDTQAVKTYLHDRDNVHLEFEEDERELMDIRAFFEGILLYFSPASFPQLFDKNVKSRSQNAELTFFRGLPQKLVEKTLEPEDKILQREVEKKRLPVEQGLAKKISTVLGLYDLKELIKYFETLASLSSEAEVTPAAFLLTSSNHAITANYDSEHQCWRLIDANMLPVKEYKTHEEMAKEVLTSFSDNDYTTFSTEIYSLKSQTKNVKKWLDGLNKNPAWNKLQDITEKLDKRDSYGAGLFHIVALNGRVEDVDALLATRADINMKSEDGVTPLYAAVRQERVELAKILLEKKADADIARDTKATPLYTAVQKRNLELIQILLEAKANPNLARDPGVTPLYFATDNGDSEVVKLLLDSGADPNQVCLDSTPLHVAIKKGHMATIRVLLDADKINPNTVSEKTTPLHLAIHLGKTQVVKELLAAKADINAISPSSGANPLHLAVENGSVDIVHTLLDNKSDVNMVRESGETPLYIAAYAGHMEILLALLEARADINTVDENGASPLYMAVQEGHHDAVEMLLEKKADPSTCKTNGVTALFLAAQNGNVNCAKALLTAKADIDKPGRSGMSPLHIAVQNGHTDVIEELLSHKADINITLDKGMTPLYTAIQNGNAEVVNTLLEHGALLNNKVEEDVAYLIESAKAEGREEEAAAFFQAKGIDVEANEPLKDFLPLHTAVYLGHEDIVKSLLVARADVFQHTAHGIKALELAELMGRSEIVEKLRERPLYRRTDL